MPNAVKENGAGSSRAPSRHKSTVKAAMTSVANMAEPRSGNRRRNALQVWAPVARA